jgi:hypothetical protein
MNTVLKKKEYDLIKCGFSYLDLQNMSNKDVELFYCMFYEEKLREQKEIERAKRGK